MPWETDHSSGLLTGFRGTIVEQYFGTNPKYNDGKTTLLCWQLEDLEIVQDDFDGEVPDPHVIELPVGSDWFTEDGKVAQHKKHKERFHASSWMGKLVDAILASDPGYEGPATANYGENAERTDGQDLEVDFGDLAKILADRGDPTEADIWHGLRFEYTEVLFDFGPDRSDKSGKTRMTSRRTVPVRFLGESATTGQNAKPAATPRKSAAKKAAAKPANDAKSKAQAARERAAAAKQAKASDNGDNPLAEYTADVDVAAQLLEVLTGADDYNAFVDGALEIEAVERDDDLLAAVVDEEAGPWSKKAELA